MSILRDENRPESRARSAFDFEGAEPEQIIQVSFAGPIAEAKIFSTTGATTDALGISHQILRIHPDDQHALATSRVRWADVETWDEKAVRFCNIVEALAIRPPNPGEVQKDTLENPTFRLLLRLSEETRELVNQNWPLIEGFASLLSERKLISAEDAESHLLSGAR